MLCIRKMDINHIIALHLQKLPIDDIEEVVHIIHIAHMPQTNYLNLIYLSLYKLACSALYYSAVRYNINS